MAARTVLLRPSIEHSAPRMLATLRMLARKLDLTVLHPYHPERHYMRGPGPRWHEKHDAHSTDRDALV
jgi:hypothetical protein